jgi:hypothetical protein
MSFVLIIGKHLLKYYLKISIKLVKKYTKVVEENDNYIRIKNRTAVRTTS